MFNYWCGWKGWRGGRGVHWLCCGVLVVGRSEDLLLCMFARMKRSLDLMHVRGNVVGVWGRGKEMDSTRGLAHSFVTCVCVMTCIYVRYDAIIRDMTQPYVGRDMTHHMWHVSYRWHDSFVCAITQACVVWPMHQWHAAFICDTTYSCVTWPFMCDMTHFCVTWHIYTWCDTFIRDVTHSYVI